MRGSVLDDAFMASLGTFDVVYSWGVLHHTGAMWRALELTAAAVKPGGLLFIALYNDQGNASRRWLWIKQTYNRLPRALRNLYVAALVFPREVKWFLAYLIKGNPMGYIRTWTDYGRNTGRGMNKWRDWVDWIGGLPFEVAKPEQVLDALRPQGFELVRMKTVMHGWGCNEYVLHRHKPGPDDRGSRIAPEARMTSQPVPREAAHPARLRIAFVIATMTAGGAERVAATLCNAWAEQGHEVHLITFERDGTAPHYELDSGIVRHGLDLLRRSRSLVSFLLDNVRRVSVLRGALRAVAPDVTVSFMPEANVIALLAGVGQRWPTVVSERVHPAYVPLARAAEAMRRLTYPRAATVVAQTAVIADYVQRQFGAHAVAVPNPIDLRAFRPRAEEPVERSRCRILSIGRLDRQKGFDVLIDAFAKLAPRHPEWELVIFGHGDQRAALERQIAEQGLGDRVRLPGVTTAIAAELQEADLYVHASRFEGYPNAVMEALACGCPVIATDSPGGARELLQDGAYGQLVRVDDVAGLAAAMGSVMADAGLRRAMRRKAPEAVADLAVDPIAAHWIDLFHTVIVEWSRRAR